jgi:hypothetical protein
MDIFLNHGNFGSGSFKPPFEKGGFKGISASYITPSSPFFKEGNLIPGYTPMS